MNIIYENKRKSESYLPHELNTRYYAVLSYRNGNKATYVCRKYHISKSSISRWNRKFDGTKDSLIDKSHKPLSPHPNSHTKLELKWINNYIRRNPHITLCELWYKLKLNKGYTRHPVSLYRVLKRIGYCNKINIKATSKYVPKKYNTPKELGKKWQIDVKFEFSDTKTRDSRRIIPITKVLLNDLKMLYEQDKKDYYGFNDDFFVVSDAKPIADSNIYLRRTKLATLAGLKVIRIHDFKHSCVSLPINNGANVTLVAKYLGHTKIEETLNTYSHMFSTALDSVVSVIDSLEDD